MIILGIDPGRQTGWGLIRVHEDRTPEVLRFGVTRDLTQLEILPMIQEADHVIVESFHIRPGHARKGSFDWDPMETPQVIGALKVLCAQYEKPIEMQNPSAKPAGYGFLRQKYVKGKKDMHQWDALAHALYWAVTNGHSTPLGKRD